MKANLFKYNNEAELVFFDESRFILAPGESVPELINRAKKIISSGILIVQEVKLEDFKKESTDRINQRIDYILQRNRPKGAEFKMLKKALEMRADEEMPLEKTGAIETPKTEVPESRDKKLRKLAKELKGNIGKYCEFETRGKHYAGTIKSVIYNDISMSILYSVRLDSGKIKYKTIGKVKIYGDN